MWNNVGTEKKKKERELRQNADFPWDKLWISHLIIRMMTSIILESEPRNLTEWETI